MHLRHLFIFFCLTISACGFHLRGWQGAGGIDIASLHIRAINSASIAQEITSQLQLADVTVTSVANEAEYILTVANEVYDRTVLSVSATTGKVEEYKLTLTGNISIATAAGKLLIDNEAIIATRDYTFDENAILGKSTEENVLREELTRQAASQIIRRLNAAVKDQ